MAYTPEQEFQLELESVRLAKEVLLENARNKPIDDREVSADEITAFAETLISYVNS
jgi:hypothetical protein